VSYELNNVMLFRIWIIKK